MTTRNHLAKISLTRKYGWNLLLSFKKNNNNNAKRRCKNYKMTPIDVLLDTLTNIRACIINLCLSRYQHLFNDQHIQKEIRILNLPISNRNAPEVEYNLRIIKAMYQNLKILAYNNS